MEVIFSNLSDSLANTSCLDQGNYSPGVQLPHGGLRVFPLKRLNQRVQQIDALLA